MNSKNIPADIKNKSIEEAQKEVSDIIEILENEENLENSIEKYNRLILLNNYIEQKFKNKSKNIVKKNFENIQNSLSKN
ncbi:MAG: exonuclease VII small subunit [Pelagibacteraceae bacterium]|nr:exonuclease VII small subunit [Pelagibacteraceae bacterium]